MLRLFVALWPDPPTREAVALWQRAWTWPQGAALVPARALHLTLHFLGNVPAQRLASVTDGLNSPVRIFLSGVRVARRLAQRGGGAAPGPMPACLLRLHADAVAARSRTWVCRWTTGRSSRTSRWLGARRAPNRRPTGRACAGKPTRVMCWCVPCRAAPATRCSSVSANAGWTVASGSSARCRRRPWRRAVARLRGRSGTARASGCCGSGSARPATGLHRC